MNLNKNLLKIIGFLLPQLLLLLLLSFLPSRAATGTAHSNGETRLEFRVREEQDSGTEIGRIPIRPNFRYRFNEAPDEFELDSNTGLLRTKMRLDRERLPIDYFDLVVLSSQPTYPIEIRIEIEDVNDNRPQFPERLVQIRIAENIQLRRRLLLDTAIDADKGENGLTDRYAIVSGNENGHFSLVTTKSHDSAIFYLHLQIEKSLDRELQSTFLLNISATDNSVTEPLTGYQQVNIIVVDVNDNTPVFQPIVYNVSVSETVTIGTSIVKVHATDRDEGANAKIAYFLLDEEDDDVISGSGGGLGNKRSDRLPSSQFEIDRDTGLITAAVTQLSCPKQEWCASQKNCAKSCIVTVLARDYGEPSRDSRCFVHVNLIDANNHDPMLSFRFLPLNAKFATVDENSPNNSVVAIISVTDADQGLNGETEVSITAGNDLKHFRLELAKSFSVLRVNRPLDREQIAMYNLTVEARDKGSPARKSVRYLIVWVNDINDHEPVFTKSEYSASLLESSPRGTFVASLTALDDDTGINAEIYYSIVSGDNNDWFEIDEQTGLVVTNGRLDREQQGVVELKVQARDNGPNPKYTFTMLLVSVLDVNDEKPRFLNTFVNVSVSENTKVPSVLTVVSATDRDQGTNGSIVYRLHSKTSMEYGTWFSLDSQSGQLSLVRSLDYERQTEYELKIVAEDQGIPWTQSETCTVRIVVTDVNDNRPRFEARSKFLMIDDEMVQTIGHVKAVDIDGPLNSRVTYRLDDTEHSSIVDLVKETGEIRLRKSLDKSFVQVKIWAEDQNGLLAETPLDLILLRQITYKPIIFANNNYAPIELKLNGTDLVQIQTTNGDKDNRFFLTTFDNLFQIDSRTGVVTLRLDISNEQIIESNYTVHVAVWNQVQNLYGQTHVNITNTRGLINNFRPKFLIDNDDSLVLKIREDKAIGEEVFVVKAVDKDFGPNGLVSYSLLNNREWFTIGEQSGVLSVRKKLSGLSTGSNGEGRGQSGRLTLQIEAKDQSSLDGTVIEYAIEIVDVNDHTPNLNGSTTWTLEISVMESMAVNERFYRLEISDEDNGANGELHYEISLDDEDNDDFGIFPDGFLYVRRPLDRETKDFYTIRVLVSDDGMEQQRFSQGVVLISVLDENDNRPQFSNQTYSFVVGENELEGIIVGQVEATDADRGRNAELFYFMVKDEDELGGSDEDANSFEVDRRTGVIRTTKTFDRENSRGEGLFTFEVWVTDNAVWGKQLQDKCKVYVRIRDVNDNPPVFFRLPYRTQITEASLPGAHVIKLYAIDADEGSNSYVFYRIVDGNENESFTIDEGTGQITIRNRLDRESVQSYRLLVEAYDLPTNPKKSLKTLTEVEVEVLDENDNRPEIEMNRTEVHVRENLEIGSVLAEFRAMDKDRGRNGQVEFNIKSGNRRETFSLDTETGVLRLKKPLDYEDIRSFQLTVTVSDRGEPRLSSSAVFVVNVADVNDNRPQFSHTAIVRRVSESSGATSSTAVVDVPIMTVLAEDADSGSNGQVEYRIKESTDETGDAGRKYFRIDPKSGVIYRTAEIDREQIESFRLTIVATDLAVNRSERLEAEKTVTIVIDDVNDNRPVFRTGTVMVHEGWLGDGDNGNFVRIEATDADAYTNGLVTYDLIDHDGWFAVNRTSGWLRLLKRDAAGTSRIQLTIRATDEAAQNERKFTDLNLTLFVFDDHDNENRTRYLDFLNRQQVVTVFEAEPAETEVTQVVLAAYNSTLVKDVRFYLTNITSASQETVAATANAIDEMDEIWLSDNGPAFSVDATTGLIRTVRDLDRERGPDRFILEIFAIGSVHGQLVRAQCSVEVQVLDKNDSPPKFDQKSLKLIVSEDAVIGQEIGVLKATDFDEVGILSYKLLNDTLNLFELNDGVIILAKILDREQFANYFVQVQVNDGVQFTNAILHVQISDSNDNAPQFTKDIYSFDIDEDSIRGKMIGKISASDKDTDSNAQLSFSIISDWYSDILDLGRETGILTLKAHLDYETTEHYIFVVQAEDKGQPSLSSTATLYLNVLDLNDNSPIFDSLTYAVEVYENISTNTPIVTVTATDQDSDENGRIEYSISSGNENGTFSIDKRNGTIKLASSNQLDREQISSYDLIVTAIDCATDLSKRRSTNVQVFITVKDVNDVAPEFIGDRSITIDENLAPNSLVTIVKAIDRDENRNGYVEYTLLEENGQSLLTASGSESAATFELGAIDGQLRVSSSGQRRLDREQIDRYRLKIAASDKGDPSLQTIVELIIHVADSNDNRPIFEPRFYSITIAENGAIGTPIIQVNATDKDIGLNGLIRYSIIEGDENRDFRIDERNGQITIAKTIDYERKRRYDLKVRAEDCALPDRESLTTEASGQMTGTSGTRDTLSMTKTTNSDVASVTIHVSDRNDNRPMFVHSPYSIRVRENYIPTKTADTAPGLLLTVTALDRDSDTINRQIRYALEKNERESSPSNNDGMFRMNATNGQLFLMKPFDRESQSEYWLTVVAVDSGTPEQIGTGSIQIIVIDENDESPEFEQLQYFVEIAENNKLNLEVIEVRAFDNDEGPNSQITYRLKENGEHSDKFAIDSQTGILRVMKSLDREEIAEFNLEVLAEDLALDERNRRSTIAKIHVTVLDDNDNRPEFQTTKAKVFVPNTISGDELVYANTATDRDTGNNSRIAYRLIDNQFAKFFQIDAETGIVRTRSNLDSIFRKFYTIELLVEAADCGGGSMLSGNLIKPLRSVYELKIYAKNRSEFPVFSSLLNSHLRISENATQFEPLTKIAVVDTGASVEYGIVGGRAARWFRIDRFSGQVDFLGSIASRKHNCEFDREQMPFTELMIAARRPKMPEVMSIFELKLELIDVNDNAPEFERDSYHFTIPEEEPIALKIGRVTANDRDASENSRITYKLLDSHENRFSIESETGEILAAPKFDREQQQWYRFEVEASDNGRPEALRSRVIVTVEVLDRNDNAPHFTQLFSANVTENCALGTFVVQVSSSDRDVGQNANRIFNFLQNPGDKFVIDPLSGNITVMDTLDREIQDEYILTVRVFDGAWASSTTVTIAIQDENDNEPKFEKDHYWFNVLVDEYDDNDVYEHEEDKFDESEGGTGQVIGRVHAFDNDKPGPNSQIRYRLSTETNSHHHHSGSRYFPHGDHGHTRTVISSGVESADWFTIDSKTGQLRAKRPLRYRKSKRYRNENRFQFEIEVSDSGSPPTQFTTSCDVIVNLVPRQHDRQQQPMAAMKFERDRYLVALMNSSRQGDDLVRVKMTAIVPSSVSANVIDDREVDGDGDGDDHLTDDLQFKLNENGNWSKYFQVDERTGLIQLLNDDLFRLRKVGERLTIEIEARDAFRFGFGVVAETMGVAMPVAKCSVDVVIVTENREAPIFSANSYQVIIPENEPIGTIILGVNATDADGPETPNGLVQYRIVSGNKNKEFTLNSTTGLLTINRNLDYERQQHYQLNVTAEDCGVNRRTTNALIKIALKDLNDNRPKFAHESYRLQLAENSAAGTLVGRIQATDADSGVNAAIRYRWLSGPKWILTVDEISGAIHSNASVDFEQTERLEYELSAWNPSSSNMVAGTTVSVHVEIEGRNEFVPQFVRKVFQFEISETAAVGTVVGRVEAFDQDAGRDGQIYFYFQENKREKLFEIDKRSGRIRVARELDRETRNRVTLTVLAKNHGPIRGQDIDEAQVIIAIEDGNDPPEFESNLYDVQIRENVAPGTRIVTVRAHDKDLRTQNNQFVYALIGLNRTSAIGVETVQAPAFKIDSRTGQIETTRKLDRELIEIHELKVAAIDSGEPAKTGHTLVRVRVEDVNDNAPYLDGGVEKFYGEVPENEPIGTKIGQLEAHDSDADPNRGPFKYRLIEDRLDSDYVTVDNQSGWVRTRKVIDRELKQELEILVEIADNGRPEMVSKNRVKFRVTDRNDMPSRPRDLQITGKFARHSQRKQKWLEIADLRPNDFDLIGDYSCRLAANDDDEQKRRMFRFAGSHSCRFEMDFGTMSGTEPKSNSIRFQVSANDGRHANVLSNIRLDYDWLDYEWESVEQNGQLLTVRMANTTLDWFLTDGLSKLSRADLVAPISIQATKNTTDLLVTFVSENTAKLFANIKNQLASSTISNYSICSPLLSSSSPNSICENNGKCRAQTKINRNQLEISETNTRIFTGLKIEHLYTCECRTNFHGERCEKSANPCDPNPCTDRQQCVRDSQNPLEFQCVCTNGRDGRLCELERPRLFCRERVLENETRAETRTMDMGMIGGEWCENGGSCRESPDTKLGFFCLCRAGFRGQRCEFRSDSCRPNPCLNQGIICGCIYMDFRSVLTQNTIIPKLKKKGQCSNIAGSGSSIQSTTSTSKFGYRCSCPDGYYGKHCERSNYAFDPLSYMHFASLDAASNDISIVFSIGLSAETTSTTSLLLYNYGRVVSGGRSDFFVLEVTHDGIVSFSFGGSRTAIFTLTLTKFGSVANGNWFRVNLVRNGRLVSLSAAKCSDSGQSCEQCKSSDDRCYVNGIGPTGTLNFDNNPLEIGGLANVDALLERPDQTHSDDFVGCIHSITVNGQQLNLAKPRKSKAIRTNCKKCRSEPIGAFATVNLAATTSIEFGITQKHRRVQLLNGNSGRKTLSLHFRTMARNGRLLKTFSAQKWSTTVELWDGRLVYQSSYGAKSINLTSKGYDANNDIDYSDGIWHNLTLQMIDRRDFNLFVDGRQYGDTLDASIIHDFLDPYLVTVIIGGVSNNVNDLETEGEISRSKLSLGFSGCIANVTINGQLQSFRADDGTNQNRFLNVTLVRGSSNVHYGCERSPDIRATISTTDPLNIGILLIVGFFVILFMAISGSFLMFRFKTFDKNAAVITSASAPTTSTATTLLSGTNSTDAALLHKSSSNDLLLNRANHHYIDSELVQKKYKERSENGSIPISLGVPPLPPPPPLPPLLPPSDHGHHHPYHHMHPYHHHHLFNHVPSSRPDLIGRDHLVTAPEHVQMIAASTTSALATSSANTTTTGTTVATDLNSEHYDLENISSIAPSDIGIVYNYKSYYQHQHHNGISAGQGGNSGVKHRGGMSNVGTNNGGAGNSANAIRLGTAVSLASRQHQVTPLARLSPSSELSSQQPRILTLHDISGGGAGSSSSGPKQLPGTLMSTHSGGSKASGGTGSAGKGSNAVGSGNNSAHINHERSSSLLSTMDAVSSSSDLDNRSDRGHSGGSSGGHRRRNPSSHQQFQRSSRFQPAHPLAKPTTDDESGNESFTYSEIEFDDGNMNETTCVGLKDMSINKTKNMSSSAILDKHQSFSGGSVSTLVASDDDASSSFENDRDNDVNDDYDMENDDNCLEHVYDQARVPEKVAETTTGTNGRDSPSIATLGWEYLLNWSPSYGANLKDIAEFSERRLAVQQQQQRLIIHGSGSTAGNASPALTKTTSEEYV